MALRRGRRRGLSTAFVSAALLGGLLTVPATAQAQDFYTPPETLPGAPGELIRTEDSHLALSIPTPDGGTLPGKATRLLYRSNDANGLPNAVSGTYIEPTSEWTGAGERPLVVIAPGTHGQGDQCAPSRLLNSIVQFTPPLDFFTEYEIISMTAMLLQGYSIVVTDYDGLGTPGHHTYVNRAAEAHAVLDAARAAQNLEGTTIGEDGPVALYGYSQGGGAVAAAAELAPEYAPDLDIKGGYAGAPPADLSATLEQIDGTALTGAIGYTINGLVEAYPDLSEILDAEINDSGRTMLAGVGNQCLAETLLHHGFQTTNQYTRTGESLSEVIARTPRIQEIIDEQRIGKRTPDVPMLIQHGTQDDIVPYGQGRQLALDWCDNGATVQFSPNHTPPILPGLIVNHFVPMLGGKPEAVAFIGDRFNDVPVTGNCGQF